MSLKAKFSPFFTYCNRVFGARLHQPLNDGAKLYFHLIRHSINLYLLLQLLPNQLQLGGGASGRGLGGRGWGLLLPWSIAGHERLWWLLALGRRGGDVSRRRDEGRRGHVRREPGGETGGRGAPTEEGERRGHVGRELGVSADRHERTDKWRDLRPSSSYSSCCGRWRLKTTCTK